MSPISIEGSQRNHPVSLSAKPKIFKPVSAKKTIFLRGDEVEVASNQEGFEGSYFEATVVTEQLTSKEFVVQYKTLVKDDFSGPLNEVVASKEVRPVPPEIPATEFKVNDIVDAFDNDGWWVGKVTGRDENDKYLVYFEYFQVELAYEFERLRIHQDWINGKWINPNNRRSLGLHVSKF